VRRRFERWRATRAGHSRIPANLWSAVVRAAGKYGLTQKKSRIIDSIADGMVPRGDPTITAKLREIDDQILLLTARLEEIEGVRRTQLDPDLIATRLVERVRNLAGFLESHRVEDQRKALFAFCKRIVADAMIKEVVIETDLIGLAQLPDTEELPVGTPMEVVAALGAQENAQPAECGGLCNWTLAESNAVHKLSRSSVPCLASVITETAGEATVFKSAGACIMSEETTATAGVDTPRRFRSGVSQFAQFASAGLPDPL